MKAINIHNYGGPEQLKFENINIPEINDDQILVKVKATSVNHLEIKKASGVMKQMMPLNFPWIPGHDFAGIIEKTGKNVTEFKKGDEVYGNCNGGSYAEYLAADTSKTVKKPRNLSFTAAASVPHVAETAWQAIHTHGNLKTGQNVLIHGAAGAVGAYAVQFAYLSGAHIYATASEKDFDLLKSLCVNHIINYKKEDFTKIAEDIDLVIDLVGGDTQKKSYLVMKSGGKLVSTVGISTEKEAKENNITTIGMVIKQSGKDLQKITNLIEKEEVATDVSLILPFEKAAEAWEIMNRSNPSLPTISHGKIVLEIGNDE